MSKRDELLFLQDILDSVNAIFEFTHGLDAELFSQNRLIYSATIREFEIIGEATPFIFQMQHCCNTIKFRGEI